MYNNQYLQPQFGNNQQFQQTPQYNAPNNQFVPKQINVLQGKIIDNLDVVKAMDIPMDGSLSIFPLADKSAIATKQLMVDGTSKIIIYKPLEEKEEKIEYITKNDVNAILKDFSIDDLEDIKDEIKDLKKEIKNLKKEK